LSAFYAPGNCRGNDFSILAKIKDIIKEQVFDLPERCVMPLMLVASLSYPLAIYITQYKGQSVFNPGSVVTRRMQLATDILADQRWLPV
jgi:hypothetical protein